MLNRVVLVFLLTSVFLQVLSNASLAPRYESNLVERQDGVVPAGSEPSEQSNKGVDDDLGRDMDMGMGMSGESHSVENGTFDGTTTPWRPPEGHDHGSHTPPKDILDDEDIHWWHHFPVTYLSADFRLDRDSAIFGEEFPEGWDPEQGQGHRTFMGLHVLGMILAYFGALPLSLVLRAADHPSHYIAYAVFLGIACLGWLAGTAYKVATPERYEGSKHGTFGNVLLLVSIGLALLDYLGLLQRLISYYKSGDRSWHGFSRQVFSSQTRWLETSTNGYEMVGTTEQGHHRSRKRRERGNVVFAIGDDDEEEDAPVNETRPSMSHQWFSPSRRSSGSDGTLNDHHQDQRGGASSSKHSGQHERWKMGQYDEHEEPQDHAQQPKWSPDVSKPVPSGLRRFGEVALTWIRGTQVVFAYVVTLLGLITYSGMCRGSYISSCAAHYVKGSIFFGYGVLTFGRYLGAYADLGWAWNRRPDGKHGPSAEMIECAVIFVYGITNTWLERIGAAPGDPYTVKQVQHISIAIMFWFAGLMGMLLESRRVRRFLAMIVGRHEDSREPASYAFSFNPIPGLVIAVTGLAMAAHHQNYIFQVQIHSLWGILLAGGSACRFLTYFFLWIRPPVESTMPSRPPTELLTSFGWAAGGIVFMLSVEEISFAAMRAGYDDMMAFLNVTVALTSLVFCWETVVMAVKGLAVMRLQSTGSVGRPIRDGRV